jgi:hypothetical protein
MGSPKETSGECKTGYGKDVGATGAKSATQPGKAGTAMEYCHGSVCLGSQKPTHCICPTDKK